MHRAKRHVEVSLNHPCHGRGGWRSGRKLVLVDDENLLECAPSDATQDDHDRSIAALVSAVHLEDNDHVVMASHPSSAFALRSAWARTGAAQPCLKVRHGADGADNALLDECDSRLLDRFATIVIGSGDHAFIDIARQAHAKGMTVVVVGPANGIHRPLAHLADQVCRIAQLVRSGQVRSGQVRSAFSSVALVS